MTFQQLFTWMVEYEPLDRATAVRMLKAILQRLGFRIPRRLPPRKPHSAQDRQDMS